MMPQAVPAASGLSYRHREEQREQRSAAALTFSEDQEEQPQPEVPEKGNRSGQNSGIKGSTSNSSIGH